MGILSLELARITSVMKEQNMTQKELCERLGIKQNAFTNWKGGNNTSYIKYIPQIADILNVSADYLLGKTDDPRPVMEKAGLTVIPVGEQAVRPIIGMASAGRGVWAQEEILGWETVDARYNTDDYFYLKISGDSMAPRIEDGDLVLVHRQVEVEIGDVAVVLVKDNDTEAEGFVKKVEFGPDMIRLISFNPYYPPMEFVGNETSCVTFVGKVVELKRKF